MSLAAVVAHAQALWEELAVVPVSFMPGRLQVVVSPQSLMCPAGWVGAVVLQGSAIATAPDTVAAEQVRTVGFQIPAADIVNADRLSTVLPVVEARGPAALAYSNGELFRPAALGARKFERVSPQDRSLSEFLASTAAADRDESGLDEITSSAFVVRSAGVVASAAGYRVWPNRTAQVSVLTAPDRRGQGLARIAASAAVEHALTQGLVPQWRARTTESRRVATALGFYELGAQLSFRLNPPLRQDQEPGPAGIP